MSAEMGTGKRRSRRQSRGGGDASMSRHGGDAAESSSDSGVSSLSDEVHPDGDEFANVADLFLRGLGVLLGGASIAGISRISLPATQIGSFQRRQIAMTRSRPAVGANLHWAWYGAPGEEVREVVRQGFSMAVPSSVGYCFAPLECSRISAVQSSIDQAGDQFMILCQLVLGKVGLVGAGSVQDTGVYDLANPKSYVIPRECFEDSRVLPQYVVRFRLSEQWQDVIRASTIAGKAVSRPPKLNLKRVSAMPSSDVSAPPTKKPRTNARIMSFPTLFSLLKPKLPSANLESLWKHYLEFKHGGMARQEFITRIRDAVGDTLLYKSICFIKLWSQGCEDKEE